MMQSKLVTSTCLMCGCYVPPAARRMQYPVIVSQIEHFMQETLMNKNGDGISVESLLSTLEGLSPCGSCLKVVREATEAAHQMNQFEQLVRQSQQQLLNMMLKLRELVDIYLSKMHSVEEMIREGKERTAEEGSNEQLEKFREQVLSATCDLNEWKKFVDAKDALSSVPSAKSALLKEAVDTEINHGPEQDPPTLFLREVEHDNTTDPNLAPPTPRASVICRNARATVICPPKRESVICIREVHVGRDTNHSGLPLVQEDARTSFGLPSVASLNPGAKKGKKRKRVFKKTAFSAACPRAAYVSSKAKNLKLTCEVCGRPEYKTRMKLYQHWWWVHSGHEKKYLKCSICGKSFQVSYHKKHETLCAARGDTRQKGFGPHKAAEKSQKKNEKRSGKYKEETRIAFQAACPRAPNRNSDPFTADIPCGVCGKSGFATRLGLMSHWQIVHRHSRRSNDGPLQCDICGEQGFNKLSTHQSRVHGIKKDKSPTEGEKAKVGLCENCGKVFETRKSLYNHRKSMHPTAQKPKKNL